MENSVESSVFESIRRLLLASQVEFRVVSHSPTFTSEDSANARGEDLSTGAKALLLKCEEIFAVFVLPADRKLQSQLVRKHLGFKNCRFATPEELRTLTGLVPGSVPPFGRPIFPLALYADEGTGRALNKVAFNAGSLTTSIIMSAEDWRRVAAPEMFSFAAE